MSIRNKTLLIIGTTLFFASFLLYSFSSRIVLNDFLKLEREYLYRNLDRVSDAIEDDIMALKGKLGDWSNWDDTYDFILDPGRHYLDSNISDTTFKELKIDAIVFIDLSGRVVYSRGFDFSRMRQTEVSKNLLERLGKGSVLLEFPEESGSVSGLMLLPEGMLMFASRPILNSQAKGPRRGVLVFARYLDREITERISAVTHLSFELYRSYDPNVPVELQRALLYRLKELPVVIRAKGDESISGYQAIKDIYGKPAIVLRVDDKRDIYLKGRQTAYYLVFSIVLAGLLLAAAVFYLMNMNVLSPLANLSSSVSGIAAKGDFSRKLKVRGRDELSVLAQSINGLLESLESKIKELRQSSTDLNKTNLKLHDEVSAHKQAEADLVKLSKAFIAMGEDCAQNIHILTNVCGDILGARLVLYNRMEESLLLSIGKWKAPQGFKDKVDSEGSISHDVIVGKRGSGIVTIHDLEQTPYFNTDKRVSQYGLKTYIGCPVQRFKERIGVLCAFYAENHVLEKRQQRLMEIIATAIGIEEERMYTQDIMRKSRDTYQTILDSFPLPVWQADNKARAVYLNKAWLEFTGSPMDKELGSGWLEAVSAQDRERFLGIYATAAKTNDPFRIELSLKDRYGKYRSVVFIAEPFGAGAGGMDGYIGSACDIAQHQGGGVNEQV